MESLPDITPFLSSPCFFNFASIQILVQMFQIYNTFSYNVWSFNIFFYVSSIINEGGHKHITSFLIIVVAQYMNTNVVIQVTVLDLAFTFSIQCSSVTFVCHVTCQCRVSSMMRVLQQLINIRHFNLIKIGGGKNY